MITDEERIVNARIVSLSIALEDLCSVLMVHRENCRQLDCPILAALEDRVGALGTPGAPC
jgi:hypothetical protein